MGGQSAGGVCASAGRAPKAHSAATTRKRDRKNNGKRYQRGLRAALNAGLGADFDACELGLALPVTRGGKPVCCVKIFPGAGFTGVNAVEFFFRALS
jgi:hypothetical protein